jgi:hypothetical protein
MSTPSCDRPPERGAPQLSTNDTDPRTGHTRLPVDGGGSAGFVVVGADGFAAGFVVGGALGRAVGEPAAGGFVVVACARAAASA